jgi:uncharacterized protein YkwD
VIAFDQPINVSNPVRHQHAVTVLVNRERGKAGLPPLRQIASLRRSARRWGLVQTRLSFFGHGDFARRSFGFPFVQAGRPGTRSVAENIAWGAGWRSTPRHIVQMWMQSPPHRATILGNWRYTGVATIADAPLPGRQRSGVTVVEDFGR